MKWFRSIALTLVGLVVLATVVRLMMPLPARALVRSDKLLPADMIVVLSSGRLERTFEAATLYREGWSKRILLLRAADISTRGLLKALNVRAPVLVEIQKDILRQMGVPESAILVNPVPLGNTRAEAEFTIAYLKRAGIKRVIVVTSPYHTARAGRYFRRASGKSVDVIMRANRYERVDPNHWWRWPLDRNDVVLEHMKTIHGFIPD